MTVLDRTLDLIESTAKIPSFSSFEERMHPFILHLAEHIPGCEITIVAERNIALRIPGNKNGRVALTAHLDKINHFGENPPEELPCIRTEGKLIGQMDNTAGIGIVMALAENSQHYDWPELLILLSEMEESTGLKLHPHLMRNAGEGLYHGMGAERLSAWLIDQNLVPDAIFTIDTTPLFKGEKGCAVYSGHWEFTKTTPTDDEQKKTANLVNIIQSFDSEILHRNNTNDYLTYGKWLNTKTNQTVPSLALEPAIFPYHTKNESVFTDDINRILKVMIHLLDHWGDLPVE